jgi:flavorubredoxin
MVATVDEIADGIFRLSTLVEDAAPGGFSFNQFLVMGEQPMLFHAGPRAMFPLVSEAVGRVTPVDSLRWISFGHVESDECGATNLWLAAAPRAEVVFNPLGCDVSLNDLCDRLPRVLDDGAVLDTGGKRLRTIATPHVPHGWEAQVLFEETTGTLLCGDLFSQTGAGPALTESDVVGPAVEAEMLFGATALAPHTSALLRSLGDLHPRTLAIMHGSSFRGDGRAALHGLADAYASMASERA